MLFDFNRGTRNVSKEIGLQENSVTMTVPLFFRNSNPENIKVNFFSPYDSNGIMNTMFSKYGYSEIKGTYHTKFMVFDNSVLITGANLSEEYFITRKDRYILLNDVPELADYLEDYMEVFADSGSNFVPKKDDFNFVPSQNNEYKRIKEHYQLKNNSNHEAKLKILDHKFKLFIHNENVFEEKTDIFTQDNTNDTKKLDQNLKLIESDFESVFESESSNKHTKSQDDNCDIPDIYKDLDEDTRNKFMQAEEKYKEIKSNLEIEENIFLNSFVQLKKNKLVDETPIEVNSLIKKYSNKFLIKKRIRSKIDSFAQLKLNKTSDESYLAVNFQVPLINHMDDSETLKQIFNSLLFKPNTESSFTSGYFNPIPSNVEIFEENIKSNINNS